MTDTVSSRGYAARAVLRPGPVPPRPGAGTDLAFFFGGPRARHTAGDDEGPDRTTTVANNPTLPKLPSLPRLPRKAKAEHPCACGCGLPTRSTWHPGHDAIAAAWALRVVRGIVTEAPAPHTAAVARLVPDVRRQEEARAKAKQAKAQAKTPAVVKAS